MTEGKKTSIVRTLIVDGVPIPGARAVRTETLPLDLTVITIELQVACMTLTPGDERTGATLDVMSMAAARKAGLDIAPERT